MALSILFIVGGIAAVLWGANLFTDGAADIARRFRVPQIVIGMTVVAFGTSLPEFCVSFASALKGAADIAVGNVVGSNIFNALLITGAAAAVAPIAVMRGTLARDIPQALIAPVLLAALCMDRDVTRLDGALLLTIFIVFMAYTKKAPRGEAKEGVEPARFGAWRCTLYIIIGLAALVAGSSYFVDGASDVARRLGVSDAIVGLTIAAAGTGLPELANSVVAARKGQPGLALGNVIGSNVFNSLMVIGVTGLICPMQTNGIAATDFVVLVGSTLLLWGMAFTKRHIERGEGAGLVLLYVAYTAWLVWQAAT